MPPRRKATPAAAPKRAPRKAAPKTGNDRQAQFAAFFGKTGSGKSYSMWQKHLEWQSTERMQVLCWSPKERHDHYAKKLKCKAFTNFVEFVREIRTGRDAVFVPSLDRKKDEPLFNLFCQLAFAVAPCCVLGDELHTITSATGGVHWWHQLTTMGRADGIRTLCGSQRPAHVDKDFFGALSYVHSGALLYEDDAKAIAKVLLCSAADIMALSGYQSKTRTM